MALSFDSNRTRFSVSVKHDGAFPYVVAAGELDVATAPDLLGAIAKLAHSAGITVDLEGVTFIDSSGLAALLQIRSRYLETGMPVRLRNPSGQALKLFEITGVNEMFEIDLTGG